MSYIGILCGIGAWFAMRILTSIYSVDQNERAIKTSFGRAKRINAENVSATTLTADEQERYQYPRLKVIMPGGPYFKLPWEKVHKVSISTETLNMAVDLEDRSANNGGTLLEAVTKDQLNTGLTGQIRYRVSEGNLYAFLFGVKNPMVHVMGYFISILRERIANFEAPQKDKAEGVDAEGGNAAGAVSGVSINDLRKNLRVLNEHMDVECKGSEARYGIILDASLITGIDPPAEVESALAAINTAHNNVSSDISLAQAGADQKIVQSRKAVEIETLKADAEVQPLIALAEQLQVLKRSGGSQAIESYVRNVKLGLFQRVQHAIVKGDA